MSEPIRHSVAFPFPVDGNFTARLDLPADGLRPEEADRLISFVRSLVVDLNVDVKGCEHDFQMHPESEDFGVCASCGAEMEGVVELLDPATYVRRVEAGEIDPSPGVEAREAMERYATRPGGHA